MSDLNQPWKLIDFPKSANQVMKEQAERIAELEAAINRHIDVCRCEDEECWLTFRALVGRKEGE